MSKYIEMTHEEVISACKKYMNKEQLAFVEKAYEYAEKAIRVKKEQVDNHILFTQLKLLGQSQI